MTSARRRLDRVAKGAKENGQPLSVMFRTFCSFDMPYTGSTVAIAVLILVLLILIIVLKT